jgi:catechol 2,3-dioxygenase-like lactoylglutathione lyase family enzyme
MLSVGTVVVGVDDLLRAYRFWSEALGYVPRRGEVGDDWVILDPPDPPNAGTSVALMLSETPVQDHPRIHLDLYAGDAADQRAEVERLVGLGAVRVDWDGYDEGADFVVLADTEGNRFCVIDTGA